MGGRAFPHLHVPRLSPVEYEKIRNDYFKILQKFYIQVVCPSEASEKADHENVDFLVSDSIFDFTSHQIKLALKVVEQIDHKPRSYTMSLRDESKTSYAQIDVKVCDNVGLQ